MKIRKIILTALFVGVLGLGSGLLFSGCSSVNESLGKSGVVNNSGCFIVCYNNSGNDVSTGKYAHNKRYKSKNITHNAFSEKIYG